MSKRRIKSLPGCFAILFASVVLTVSPAVGIDGTEVIDKMQNRFEDLRTLSARFTKSHYWKLADQKREIKGELFVERPDRFRFETKVQTVVTDGETAWNYSRANEQVLVSRYDTVKEDRSYEKLLFDLILLGGYSDQYVPRYLGEDKIERKDCYLVELKARAEDEYITRIRLWVDRKLWLVRKVEYVNINEDVTAHILSDLKVNKDPNDDLFTFQVPKGVESIDLR